MELQNNIPTSHTTDYQYIEIASKNRWLTFNSLREEFESFVPRGISDYDVYRAREVQRLVSLNPSSQIGELELYVDRQIRANAEPTLQMHLKFSDRVMAEYVTVAYLAHALSEAIINATLALGLAERKSTDLFALIERAEVKEKWLADPKILDTRYELPKSKPLYQTLQHLTKQRNAFVHYKTQVDMQGQPVLEGSKIHRLSLAEYLTWMNRYFSLPYDLLSHLRTQLPHHYCVFFPRGSELIERYAPHTEP